MESRAQRAAKSGTVVDAKASLALWLRSGRALKKLSLDDVARLTKIQRRILEKLETGQLDGLPADVFVRGFVRSFARCVGLDEGEALARYGAIGGRGSVGAVVTAEVPAALAFAEPVAGTATVIVTEPVTDSVTATETVTVTDTDTVTVVATEPVIVPSTRKKQRGARRKSNGQRGRKKKDIAATTALESSAESEPLVENAVEPTVSQIEPSFACDPSFAASEAFASNTPNETVANEVVASEVVASELVASEAIASDSTSTCEPASVVDTSDATPVGELAEGSAPHVTEPWRPTMPPLATASSSPWRRPAIAASAPVSPSLVIDDSDPERAEREQDERIASNAPARVSFLPPILLDREDRSARQGGLTLAVIILLIAATLTLSYLMRRPSVSGDGVTMADVPSIQLA